jgi:hypothetical protein
MSLTIKNGCTITYDEVAALVGINILTLEPRPNLSKFGRSVDTLNVHSSASHAPKASNTDGREW